MWSELSPQGARLTLRLVHQGNGIHHLVGQPLLGDSLLFLLLKLWVCGPRICAMLLRDTATPRLDLPPPRAVLAVSPPDFGNIRHVSRPDLRTT